MAKTDNTKSQKSATDREELPDHVLDKVAGGEFKKPRDDFSKGRE